MTPRPSFRALVVSTALGLAITACAGTGDEQEAGSALDLVTPGTLTVCSAVPFAPFEDFDETTESGFTGFDIDLVAAIAEDLGLALAVRDSDFTPLQDGELFTSRHCDLGASAMTITEERQGKVLFSDGYYTSQQSLLVPADSDISAISDLAGRRVGVQRGTTGEAYARTHAPEAERVPYADDDPMYLALKAGRVNAILQDLPVNLEHQRDPDEPGRFRVVETYDTGEIYGFGARKDNTALISAVNTSLQKLRDSGEYQTIFDKYFALN